jgi:RNA polymerase sigma factor (sigma-70 family)
MTAQTARTIEPWKLDLIRERAKFMRFQPADIDDAVQEIAIEIMDFVYQPDPENPASEETVLRSLIDNQLKMLRRSENRHQHHLERLRESKRSPQRSSRNDSSGYDEPSYEDSASQAVDVQDAVLTLDSPEQQVCSLLREGNSIAEIADLLECSRTTVRLHLDVIRKRFEELGIQLWVIADGGTDIDEDEEAMLVPARKAAALCGQSLRTWRTWHSAGFVPMPVHVGRSAFWRADELREWVAAGCPRREAWMAIRDQA